MTRGAEHGHILTARKLYSYKRQCKRCGKHAKLYLGVCGSCLGTAEKKKKKTVIPNATSQCPICKVAISPKNLKRHMKQQHQKEVVNKPTQKDVLHRSPDKTKKRKPSSA